MKISSSTKIGVLLLLLLFPAYRPVQGAEVVGLYTAAYEDRQLRDGHRESILVNYLSFDAERLAVANLSLHGFGKYAHEWRDGDSATSLYYLYGNHRTFEGRSELQFGRFPLESHRFLTLDGLHLTMRPDSPWGYALYAGQPRYMEIHEERLERQFRDSGDYLFGARTFLRGVEGLRANASYSREGGGGDLYREIIGIGGGKDFFIPRRQIRGDDDDEMVLALDGSLDYNPDRAVLDQLTARLFLLYSSRLRAVLQADRFDVRDDYPPDRELIISLFSTGREDRAKYTVTYDLRPEISLYQGAVYTELELPDGSWRQGWIIKGGVGGNFRETRGLGFDAGLYYFDSHLAEATGLALSVDYQPTVVWNLRLGLEAVKLNAPFRERDHARTYSAELTYRPGVAWQLAGYLEQSDNPEYRSDFRSGLRLDYHFGFALNRAPQKVGP
ncbi:MAG: hypothetical protein ACNA74_08240 [Desulfurivibrio sp.]